MGKGLIKAEVPWKENFSLAFHAKSEFSFPLTLKGKSFLYLKKEKKDSSFSTQAIIESRLLLMLHLWLQRKSSPALVILGQVHWMGLQGALSSPQQGLEA